MHQGCVCCVDECLCKSVCDVFDLGHVMHQGCVCLSRQVSL